MTNRNSTIPAPPELHRCGGCQRTYSHDAVRLTCGFIGRGDNEHEGDRGLAYYNCSCDRPGTFVLVETPPAKEPLENLRCAFAYRKEALYAGLTARASMNPVRQLVALEQLKQRFIAVLAAADDLMEQEDVTGVMRTQEQRLEILRRKREFEADLQSARSAVTR